MGRAWPCLVLMMMTTVAVARASSSPDASARDSDYHHHNHRCGNNSTSLPPDELAAAEDACRRWLGSARHCPGFDELLARCVKRWRTPATSWDVGELAEERFLAFACLEPLNETAIRATLDGFDSRVRAATEALAAEFDVYLWPLQQVTSFYLVANRGLALFLRYPFVCLIIGLVASGLCVLCLGLMGCIR